MLRTAYLSALLALSMASVVLAIPDINTLTATPGAVLNASRVYTPAIMGNPLLRVALTDRLKWTDDLLESADDYISARVCFGMPPVSSWMEPSMYDYVIASKRIYDATRDIVMDVMDACRQFHKDRVYAYTGRYPKGYGGFWSTTCRCAYTPYQVALSHVDPFYPNAVRCNDMPYSSAVWTPPDMDLHSCLPGALSYRDALSSLGEDVDYARDAIWAIPPLDELEPLKPSTHPSPPVAP